MIEDAGLFVEALQGFPGVYSAYVQRTIGNAGILRLMEGMDKRDAYFKSVVAYVEPGREPIMFDGEVHGQIGFEERGHKGFGYDPSFMWVSPAWGRRRLRRRTGSPTGLHP